VVFVLVQDFLVDLAPMEHMVAHPARRYLAVLAMRGFSYRAPSPTRRKVECPLFSSVGPEPRSKPENSWPPRE
jgi:hypothetical protein